MHGTRGWEQGAGDWGQGAPVTPLSGPGTVGWHRAKPAVN